MEIIVAKSAGFCFGVQRAIDEVNEQLKKGRLNTYGELIHNKIVVNDLKEKGVNVVDTTDIKDTRVVIRSHGVPKDVYEQFENNNVEIIDCTCPFVKKIHRIVQEETAKNNSIIIVGKQTHPEIIGIQGWASSECIIINTPDEAKNIEYDKTKNYKVVVQTTYNQNALKDILKVLDDANINYELYNTICTATEERQTEAEEISKKVNHMIVLGDKKSSNTNKLYEISKKNCENSYLIESIDEIQLNNFVTSDKIGITAGASTPMAIIKEAIYIMSELENENQSFEEMLNESFLSPLHSGGIVEGTVLAISNGEVFLDLKYKTDGIIPRGEFSSDANVTPESSVKVGDKLEVYVIKVNDGDGNVLLSRKKVESNKSLAQLEEAYNNKEVVSGKIVDIVKGGAMALINDVRVFVPSSQISNRFVKDLDSFKGKEFDFEIIEFDKFKRRFLASRRNIAAKEEQEKKEALFNNFEVGSVIEGEVNRIVDFGAFVDIGGVDGLIHISELSWSRVKKVTDVVNVGDKVAVKIIELDKEKGKISLSLKDMSVDPWAVVPEKYAVGSVVTGKIVRIVPFGAFVELEKGIDGLIHISQISKKHIAKPEDALTVGEMVEVKVTELDVDNKKISLSKKELEADDVAEEVVVVVEAEPTEEVVVVVETEPTEEVVVTEETEAVDAE